MSQMNSGNSKTFKAGADLTEKQFYIVKISAANTVALASAATDAIVGVLGHSDANGNADVLLRSASGTGKVISGGVIAIGDALTTDANGAAIATTTDGDQIIGYALEAGVAGDIVEYMCSTARLFIA